MKESLADPVATREGLCVPVRAGVVEAEAGKDRDAPREGVEEGVRMGDFVGEAVVLPFAALIVKEGEGDMVKVPITEMVCVLEVEGEGVDVPPPGLPPQGEEVEEVEGDLV